ncbi:hypothetical protein B296_00056592 [Ensete ventricosum]|uniref:non-specific serine/threonine protein kinase n=1 Tax=Ensete ventricosum TaxID=4639 RepID=A0A426XUL3_ENSVE|nr:hypothetical protein B296_00056592 [Ensete ventricosum]
MGNICVGLRLSKNGFFQSVSATLWPNRTNKEPLPAEHGKTTGEGTSAVPAAMPCKPAADAPQPVLIEETQPPKVPEADAKPAPHGNPMDQPKKPTHIRRASSAAGLQADFVLKSKTENLKEIYSLGRKLGQGQFGTTYLCVEKATGKEYACKSILKWKLTTEEDVEDVRREIQIMHHLSGHPNVISIKDAYEDAVSVHVVMELCAGGELFDRIIQKGHYTERKAAELARVIVGVVEACHSMGVMHQIFTDVVGSPYYVAPEVLKKMYGPAADVWSAGVDGVAPDQPLDSAVLSRLKQFSAMNKLKKMAIRVIAEHLSEDEIAGLKEMFKMIDTDNSGHITFEELKAGLERVGARLKESEVYALMQAVGIPKICKLA